IRDVGVGMRKGVASGSIGRVSGTGWSFKHHPNSTGVSKTPGEKGTTVNRCLTQNAASQGAVMLRGASQQPGMSEIPGVQSFPDSWCENAPAPHSLCLEDGCSACAAYGSPCSPTGRADNDWTHEKVPQILNQNALPTLLRG